VSSYRYERRSDDGLRDRLVQLAREKPRFGYRRLHVLLRRSGEAVNHKRVHRGYREAGLSIRRKKRKHCVREGRPLRACAGANEEWALDFVHDAVESGRAIRALSVVDAYTRECLALEVDTSFASRRVTRVLEGIVAERGVPQSIRCDNGPELTSRHFLAWCLQKKIELVHIQHRQRHQPARTPLAEGILLAHLSHSRLQDCELHPFFRITDCNASLSKLKSATSFFSRHPPPSALPPPA
jgi:putative transposase